MSRRLETLEELMVSKVRIKCLKYFFLNLDSPIHLRALVRELKEEINAVRRELTRLADVKVVFEEQKGNRKYFRLNPKQPFFSDILHIFHKSFGLGGDIITSKKKLGDINFACLTPFFSKGLKYGEQNIDFFVVGNINLEELKLIVDKYQKKLDREIHYTVLKPAEFEIRKRRQDKFLFNLLIQDIIVLVGSRELILN